MAQGQGEATAQPTSLARDADALSLVLRPALWMSRVRGDSQFGGPDFSVDDNLGLNGYEASFSGEITASWGTFYEVMVDGWFFSTDASLNSQVAGNFGSVTVGIGDRLATDFAAASAGGEFDITLWQPFADRQTPWSDTIVNAKNTAADGDYKADLRFKAIGALRWYSASLAVNDATTGQSDSWALGAVMPGIGGGFDLEFNVKGMVPWIERVTIEAAGGYGSNFTNGQDFAFARSGITVSFSPTWAFEAGYRLENFTLNNNSADFDGGVQGLYFGATIKF